VPPAGSDENAQTGIHKRCVAACKVGRMGRSAPARLDADKTAEPKTRLLAHRTPDRHGFCQTAPGADTYEDVETGERVSLDNNA
jgi:hypothetical protein